MPTLADRRGREKKQVCVCVCGPNSLRAIQILRSLSRSQERRFIVQSWRTDAWGQKSALVFPDRPAGLTP